MPDETQQSESEAFDEWAILELMGHVRHVGRVREVTLAGAPMLRIDELARDGETAISTHYVDPKSGAIYRITPIEEAVAREYSRQRSRYEEPAVRLGLPSPGPSTIEGGADDEFDPEEHPAGMF